MDPSRCREALETLQHEFDQQSTATDALRAQISRLESEDAPLPASRSYEVLAIERDISSALSSISVLRAARSAELRADNAAALARGPPISAAPTLLSTLATAGVGTAMLGWLDTPSATALRRTCAFARALVAEHPWADMGTVVCNPGRWRAAFPAAVAASVAGNTRLRDADFAYFRGLRALDMSRCEQPTITDAAFAHLAGIHTLDMSGCTQESISDAAFGHLAGVHELGMWGCNQETITDDAFAHLAGIHTLDMSGCSQESISDAAFRHLAGIRVLSMGWCSQRTITDAAFRHLAGVHTLDMRGCNQRTITIAIRKHLDQAGIPLLRM